MQPHVRDEPSFGFRLWEGTPSGMRLPHSHPDIEVNYLLTGEVTYLHGGAWFRLEAGQFHVFWAGLPHVMVEHSDDVRLCWITIPLAEIMRWDLPAAFLRELLVGGMIHDPGAAGLAACDGALLRQWEEDLRAAGEAPAVARRELAARFHRLAYNARSHSDHQAPGPRGLDAAARAFDFVSRRYAEVATVADVAAALRLHPKYLIQTFKRTYRIGLWDYVLRMRVAHAQRLLLTTDEPVTAVALDAGFATLSAFYRAFAQFTNGMTPSQFRHTGPRPLAAR